MAERYKPAAHDFDICEAGRLLIISANLQGELSRRNYLAINAPAEDLAKP